MGTVLASAVIARARILMKDRSAIAQRYTDAEYLDMLNEGQLAVVRLLPSSNLKNISHVCIAGAAQTIPQDGILYVRAVANGVNSQAITPTSVDLLDAADPTWRTNTSADVTVARQAAPDPNTPYSFYVTPAGLASVLLQYAAIPASVGTVGSAISLNDVFQSALTYYIAYKAMEPDSDNPSNKTMADDFFQKFNLSVVGATPGATG